MHPLYLTLYFELYLFGAFRMDSHQGNLIKTAFLLADLPEDQRIFMRKPVGTADRETIVLRLLKTLYGLRQSPRLFSQLFFKVLRKLGFEQLPGAKCVFVLRNDDGDIIGVMGVFVDDGIIAAPKEVSDKIVKAIADEFEISDMGSPTKILGIDIDYDDVDNPTQLFLSQQNYINEVIEEFLIDEKAANPKTPNSKRTPFPAKPLTPSALAKDRSEELLVESKFFKFRRVVGLLMFVMLCTRPDISKALSDAARFSHNPGVEAAAAVKQILRYLSGTSHMGILYKRDTTRPVGTVSNFEMKMYADADFASDLSTRRSRTGGVVMAAGGAVCWWSRLQSCVTLSTCEAEMLSLIEMVKERMGLKPILDSLNITRAKDPIRIQQDNQSTIAIARNSQHSRRTKHYELTFLFIVDMIEERTLELEYCHTADMLADSLTKTLPIAGFEKSRTSLGVVHPPLFVQENRGRSYSAHVSSEPEPGPGPGPEFRGYASRDLTEFESISPPSSPWGNF